MKLSGSDRRFLAKKRTDVPIDPVWAYYAVKEMESERLVRTFTAKITHTQATRPQVEDYFIPRWCESNPEKLPSDGGMVISDLDNVQKL